MAVGLPAQHELPEGCISARNLGLFGVAERVALVLPFLPLNNSCLISLMQSFYQNSRHIRAKPFWLQVPEGPGLSTAAKSKLSPQQVSFW